MTQQSNQNRRPIITFLLITFSLSSIFYFLIINTGKLGSGFGMYVTGLMWSPGLAAIITCTLLKRNVSGLGWQWGDSRYQFWSYATPFCYALIAYLIIWLTGFGGFYNHDFIKEVSTSFGWTQLPSSLTILFYAIILGIYGMAGSAATALGEEIGWRGFLVPELFKTMSYTKTSILTGIIWSLWHYPILLFADYNSGTPAWYGLSCFTLLVISFSFIMTWFRLKSKSLWTCVLLHASHNLFIQQFFTPLTSDTGNTKYFTDEFGVVLPIICLCFAIFFWTKRKELITNTNEIKLAPTEQ